jgi:DNA-binding HxlR family transcriptional regulator
VEYALTATGESLFPVLSTLCDWALEHADIVPVAVGGPSMAIRGA